MAKKQDFMSKTMKSQKHSAVCPVCQQPIMYVRVINTERSAKTGSWRFNQNHTGVCKCNEQEVYS